MTSQIDTQLWNCLEFNYIDWSFSHLFQIMTISLTYKQQQRYFMKANNCYEVETGTSNALQFP